MMAAFDCRFDTNVNGACARIKPDKSSSYGRKVLRKKYSEVMIKKYYKRQNLLPFFPSFFADKEKC
jgi:diphthamide synthase subunit DPH2